MSEDEHPSGPTEDEAWDIASQLDGAPEDPDGDLQDEIDAAAEPLASAFPPEPQPCDHSLNWDPCVLPVGSHPVRPDNMVEHRTATEETWLTPYLEPAAPHDDEPVIVDAPNPPPSPLDSANPALLEALNGLNAEYGALGVAIIAAHLADPAKVQTVLGAGPAAAPAIPEGVTLVFQGPPNNAPTSFATGYAPIGEIQDPETGVKETLWMFDLVVPNAGIRIVHKQSAIIEMLQNTVTAMLGGLTVHAPALMGGPPAPMSRQQRRAQERRRS